MTDVQVFDGGDLVDIRYSEFEIEFGLSDVLIAPKATVQSDARESIGAGDRLRIREDGTTLFEGRLLSSGKRRRDGRRRLEAEHRAYELFDETVSINETSPTAEDVLQAALSASNIGGSFTLTYNAPGVSLADDYDVSDRSVKRIFRDIMDRAGTVWYVDGADDVITVDTYGARGTFASVNTTEDGAVVREFDPDNVQTVFNDVIVNGTKGENVRGTATDSDSISTFGRQPLVVNVAYITSTSEADAYADALLTPEPQPEAVVRLGRSVGNIAQNLSNFEISVTDAATGFDETAVVEKQTLTQGAADVELGQGRAVVKEQFNRSEKSKADNSEPGSVYGEDRIADGSIAEPKLAALSVSIDKIQDEAVAEAKVRQDAITETKIEDDAISTPKLQAGSVETGTLDSAAVTAIKIDADAVEAGKIAADAVGARELIANSITADEIDTLFLTTEEIRIGTDTNTDIIFTEEEDNTAMVPDSSGGSCQVGTSSRPFNILNAINVEIESLFTDNLTFGVQFFDIETDAFGSNDTQLVPEEDNRHTIGTTNRAFESMVAHDFIEVTPDAVNKDESRLEELDYIDWFNAPRYIQRDKDRREDADNENDGSGVELGAMANYLLEVCKSQQSYMDQQTDRIDDLTERIDALEGE